MWFDECDGFVELCRGSLPYYLLIVLPIFIIIAPANPVAASHEFPAFRMNQYDLHGVPHGCRSASISLEARSVSGWSTSRHCVVARALDLTPDSFQAIKKKAGSLIVVLPEDLSSLNDEQKEHIMALEVAMMTVPETTIPVYFSKWNPELEVILQDVGNSFITDDKAGSATEALFNSITASGYQVVVPSAQPAVKPDVKISTLHGKLTGSGSEDKLPTIAIVAHYDSHGATSELAFGAESNASGVSMLLELARLFSVVYSVGKSRPHHNLVFIVTGAGKLNYLGSKKWLEDQLDGLEGSVIQDASYVLCLDSVSASDKLYVHVSKPPKDFSAGGLLVKEIKTVANNLNHPPVEGIHKKINLADESLAWEHERYSIRRLPAATISSLRSHDDPIRKTILDVYSDDKIDKLYKHTTIVAEALARHMYNVSYSQIFSEPLSVSKDSLTMWMKYLTSQPRSASLINDKHSLVNTIKESMQKYLGEVKITNHIPDKREPEVVFYDTTKATINVYSVKPAVFDLILTIAILVYLGFIYLVVYNFSKFYNFATKISSGKSKSS
ncbi:hypothetical protein TKK_0014911 [Trichogramma kaykai]|uniref:BOS complex subunit NCLN n=1 Tax=Trichogramma kaykai TaxID=54128 RepID=A0ABD2WC61_9HYME